MSSNIKKTPQTLVKVGNCKSNLEDAVKDFSEELKPVPFGLENTVKYAIFKEAKESYLLMVSQQKDKLINSAGYNTMLTISSYSDSINQQVADRFEKETGMYLSIKVPEYLRRQFAIFGMSFQAFEKNPKAAMAIIGGL